MVIIMKHLFMKVCLCVCMHACKCIGESDYYNLKTGRGGLSRVKYLPQVTDVGNYEVTLPVKMPTQQP